VGLQHQRQQTGEGINVDASNSIIESSVDANASSPLPSWLEFPFPCLAERPWTRQQHQVAIDLTRESGSAVAKGPPNGPNNEQQAQEQQVDVVVAIRRSFVVFVEVFGWRCVHSTPKT